MIPNELTELRQWVCADHNKVPWNPNSRQKADPANRDTWCSYAEVLNKGYPHIGFVLSKEDPYTIIDLDDPNKLAYKGPEEVQRAAELNEKIIAAFDSYTEISQSGTGVHIIIKGEIPRGVRRDTVEVYPAERYMIMTGNVMINKPIEERQDLLTQMFHEMDTVKSIELDDSIESAIPDWEIIEKGENAENGDKFLKFCNGDWQSDYDSQSEADFAFLSIIAFYTKDNEQVRRIFRASPMGKREKAVKNDVYINRCLKKIRARQSEAEVDLTEVKGFAEALVQKLKDEAEQHQVVVNNPYEGQDLFPPGLVGEIADYIYKSAIRPVPEIALMASIGLVAGLIGRSYNISNTGLNQYLIVLAMTGAGKEGAANGIDAIIKAVREQCPMADDYIGPGAFASGPALVKMLDEKKCFVSILGEFGLTLQQICHPKANSALVMLKKVLLDLYTKSGWTNTLRGSVYSDKEKNTNSIQAPSITLLGESTPETFYAGLDENLIAEGLVSRFSIIEYKGKRPARNDNAFFQPPDMLVNRVGELVQVAVKTDMENLCTPIKVSAKAQQMLDEFDKFCDDKINNAGAEVSRQLWNRAHLKLLKLSGLIAVGVNPYAVLVTEKEVEWAKQFIIRDVSLIADKFTAGDVGTGVEKQESELRKFIDHYLVTPIHKLKSYKNVMQKMHEDGLIPYEYLRRRAQRVKCFSEDRLGPTKALNNLLDELCESGILYSIPKEQLKTKYSVSFKTFSITEFYKEGTGG